MSPAADVFAEALHSVDGKQFFEFARKSHEETMQRTALHSRNDGLGGRRVNVTAPAFANATAAKGKPSFLDFYPGETGRTFMNAESVVPAGARDELFPVEVLLVTPKHIDCRAGWFFPAKLIKHMAFPRWRMASHEIEIKRRRPTQSAVTRHEKRFVPWLRHNGEIVAAIFCCGYKRTEGENFPAGGHGKLVVFCRADIQSDPWIQIVET